MAAEATAVISEVVEEDGVVLPACLGADCAVPPWAQLNADTAGASGLDSGGPGEVDASSKARLPAEATPDRQCCGCGNRYAAAVRGLAGSQAHLAMSLPRSGVAAGRRRATDPRPGGL